MPRHRHKNCKKHSYESLSEESDHLPVSKRSRTNPNKKATILTSFNDKVSKQLIMPPAIAAFLNANKNQNENKNENENEQKSKSADMWQLGTMICGVECEAEFGVFLIFITLYLFFYFVFLFSFFVCLCFGVFMTRNNLCEYALC